MSLNHCAVRNKVAKYTELPQFSGSFCHGRTGEGLVENSVECGGTVCSSDHMEKFSKIYVTTSCSRTPGACEVGSEPSPIKILYSSF